MRKLTLKKETVVELSTGDLAAVVGGATTKACLSGDRICLGSLNCSYDDGCVTARGCWTTE